MLPHLAIFLFVAGTLGLLALERAGTRRTSPALWIPLIWVSLAGASRLVSYWLGLESAADLSDSSSLDGNPLDRIILTILIAAGAMVLLRRRRDIRSLLPSTWPVLLFFMYCALSVSWSDYPLVAFKRWTKAIGDVVMVLIVLTDPDPSAAAKRFLARIGFLLLPASVLLIKYFPDLGQVYSGAEGKVRYVGVATDKNTLGAICLVSGLACVWHLLDAFRGREASGKSAQSIAYVTLLAVDLWLFWKTNSMTAMACFGLASGVMVATSVPALAKRPALVHLLVLVILGFAFATLFLGVGADLVQTMGRDPTLTGRAGLWDQLLDMNEDPLLGTGFESFWLGKRLEALWSVYWWRPNEAHNGYLEIFLNLGWIGLALLAVLIAKGYRNVVGAFHLDPETGGLRLAFFLTGLTYAFTEAAFRALNPVWIIFLWATLAAPNSPAQNHPEGHENILDDVSQPPETPLVTARYRPA